MCLCHKNGVTQIDSGIRKATAIIDRLGDKMLASMEKKYRKLEGTLARHSEWSLRRLQKEEQRLQRKIGQADSAAGQQLSIGIKEKYAKALQSIQNPGDKVAKSLQDYLPGLDSLQTTFRFLDKAGASIPGIPAEKLQQLQAISSRLQSLQVQIQSAANVKRFLQERKQALKEQLAKYGLGGELMKVNKQVYYYQQQFNEYKSIINDPKKLEQKVLGLVRDIPAFRDFLSRNSFLAQLFPVPGGYGTAQALQGLQTRSAVQQQLTQQLGAGGGANPQQYLQQQVSQAQSQLNAVKDKVNQLGGGNSELEIPDFRPNEQKTKTFWKRLEYGLNIQSQKPNGWLPVTSDIALMLGYKLNDKSTIGVGAGYKLGWGKSISQIRITSEGLSLRSFLDVKLTGTLLSNRLYPF